MFTKNCEICNVADDSTLSSGGMELSSILESLRQDMKIILKWFRIDSLKANPRKFQFMILEKRQCNKAEIKINSIVINKSDTVQSLGLTTDNKLTVNEHTNNLYCNPSYKLYVLRRMRKCLTQYQGKLLYNAFINSQFNYAPII